MRGDVAPQVQLEEQRIKGITDVIGRGFCVQSFQRGDEPLNLGVELWIGTAVQAEFELAEHVPAKRACRGLKVLGWRSLQHCDRAAALRACHCARVAPSVQTIYVKRLAAARQCDYGVVVGGVEAYRARCVLAAIPRVCCVAFVKRHFDAVLVGAAHLGHKV